VQIVLDKYNSINMSCCDPFRLFGAELSKVMTNSKLKMG